MLAIIDYGVGNLQSVLNAFKVLTDNVIITSDKKIIEEAHQIVLPGVGAFGKGMENLKNKDFIPIINAQIQKGKPFLGICLGMQLLLSESEEMGHFKGLDLIKGEVLRFKDSGEKIPQIGWNNVYAKKQTLFWDVPEGSMFYFVHSYHAMCDSTDNVLMTCDYGYEFACAVVRDNIYGVQFHPEKSHDFGMALLENFVRRC